MSLIPVKSFRGKLVVCSVLATFIAVVITCAMTVVFNTPNVKDAAALDLSRRARILAAGSGEHLANHRLDDLKELLSSVKFDCDILAAHVFDPQGNLVAEIQPPGVSIHLSESPPKRDITWRGDLLTASSQVWYNKKPIGTLALYSDTSARQAPYRARIAMAIIAGVLAILLSSLLAIRFSRKMAGPIDELREIADRIAFDHDNVIPASRTGNDELVDLTDRFKSLMVEIQMRDLELQMAHDQLEKRVSQRTAELEAQTATLNQEVSERRRVEKQLWHNALHDGLTNLPNRSLLMSRLEQSVDRAKRLDTYYFAVLYMDLDDFKIINDSLGHQAGDDLLRGIGDRLQTCLRKLDMTSRPTDTTTARLGGDEFVVLLDGLKRPEDAVSVAQRIREVMNQPFQIANREIVSRISIGIATSDHTHQSGGDILRDADTALYHAKAEGKGCYAVFNSQMREKAIARLALETDMHKMIDNGELRLVYQPIVSLESGLVEGFEALVRWDHPEKGIISPAEFVPIAEETGLIVPLGNWVLLEACRQLQQWRERFEEHRRMTVSVNVSSRQIVGDEMVKVLENTLEETRLPCELLNIEITETVMIRDFERAQIVLNEIKSRGIGLRMDDFGTGYSSLSYLHAVPIDAIKLDQTFIRNAALDGEHGSTIQAVVTLAKNRGFKVIAEGVETIDHLMQLQALECEYAQGYFFAKPMLASEVEDMLINGPSWLKHSSEQDEVSSEHR